ncbi:MAG TPA: hypothetical protein VJ873_06015 [bacterium]|nr:hypothetical protein [bacterium]
MPPVLKMRKSIGIPTIFTRNLFSGQSLTENKTDRLQLPLEDGVAAGLIIRMSGTLTVSAGTPVLQPNGVERLLGNISLKGKRGVGPSIDFASPVPTMMFAKYNTYAYGRINPRTELATSGTAQAFNTTVIVPFSDPRLVESERAKTGLNLTKYEDMWLQLDHGQYWATNAGGDTIATGTAGVTYTFPTAPTYSVDLMFYPKDQVDPDSWDEVGTEPVFEYQNQVVTSGPNTLDIILQGKGKQARTFMEFVNRSSVQAETQANIFSSIQQIQFKLGTTPYVYPLAGALQDLNQQQPGVYTNLTAAPTGYFVYDWNPHGYVRSMPNFYNIKDRVHLNPQNPSPTSTDIMARVLHVTYR